MIYQEPVLAFHRFMTWHGGHVYEDGKLMPYVMLQYTGLKDKNGKEIYEGDIIAIDGGADPIKTVVFFEDGCFCVKMLDKTCELKYYIDMPFCEAEIIGNIYENKDL